MSNKMSYKDFIEKINWEGGVIAAIEYGLVSSDLNDEERAKHPEFVNAWDTAVAAMSAAEAICQNVEDMIDMGD